MKGPLVCPTVLSKGKVACHGDVCVLAFGVAQEVKDEAWHHAVLRLSPWMDSGKVPPLLLAEGGSPYWTSDWCFIFRAKC
jgi:nitroimidazol reductase NimA-like FMN-containing flavoprotein (pyridoxamine 5'-phosphate oxidase superfamily)